MKMTREFLEERAFDLGEITNFLNPGALFRHWQARRSVKHLASLDDYLLRDIGLKRSDVEWAERVPITRNAVLALEERVRQRRRFADS
jgi:uncharacterized protein YjiS (DUF1127 family)